MKHLAALAIIAVLLCGLPVQSAGTPGSASDPVISKSYIDNVFLPKVDSQAKQKTTEALSTLSDRLLAQLQAKGDALFANFNVSQAAEVYIQKKGLSKGDFTPRYTALTLKAGETIIGGLGTGFLLLSGTATLTAPLVNVNEGVEVSGAVKTGVSYLVVQAGSGLMTQGQPVSLLVDGHYRVMASYTPQYTAMADELKAKGLFQGTQNGYELGRPATRIEALVMLVRLLGEEDKALAFTGSSPFTDVPDWGKAYVAYAYAQGYTQGVSVAKGQFAPSDSVSAAQYMTFLLRALGYKDTNGDFDWRQSLAFSVSAKLFTQSDVTFSVFYRDQLVLLSYRALDCPLKGGDGTLWDRLQKK